MTSLFGRRQSPGVQVVEGERAGWTPRLPGGSASNTADSRTKPYHHGDLRQALLDASLSLMAEHGPQGFTLRAAARKAGVTPGATYHHFKDKDDLVAAVAEEGFDLLRIKLREAAEKAFSSAGERACNVGVAYVLFAVEHPTRFRVMLGYGVLAREIQAGKAIEAVAIYRFVRDVLVAGLAEETEQQVAEAELLGWWSVVHGLAFLAIDGYLGAVTQSAARTESVVRAVIDSLARRPAPSSSVRRRKL